MLAVSELKFVKDILINDLIRFKKKVATLCSYFLFKKLIKG